MVRNDSEIGPSFAQVMLNFLSAKLDVDLTVMARLMRCLLLSVSVQSMRS